MSNWGGGQQGSGSGGAGADWFERARPAYLIAVTVALLALGAGFIFTDRYQIGQAGAFPARLDRFTGEVIACIPERGCFAIVPAGQPPLVSVTTAQGRAPQAQPAQPAPPAAPAK